MKMMIARMMITAIVCLACEVAAAQTAASAPAGTTPVIKDWSSEGGATQNKDGPKDSMYLAKQGGEVTFSVSDLSPGEKYTIKNGGKTLPTAIADSSGTIKFNAALSGIAAFTVEGLATTTVMTPAFFPAPGAYGSAQNVAVICETPDAVVRYTLDGSEPTEKSELYSIPLAVAATTTVKAKAWKDARTPSPTISGTYTVAGDGAAERK